MYMDYIENPSIKDQIDLEYRYKKQAEEVMKQFIEMNERKGRSSQNILGVSTRRGILESFCDGILAWLEHHTTPRKGAKATYADLIMDLRRALNNDDKLLVTLITGFTMEEVLNSVLAKGKISVSTVGGKISKKIITEVKARLFFKENPELRPYITFELNQRMDSTYKMGKLEAEIRNYSFFSRYLDHSDKEINSMGVSILDVFIRSTNLFTMEKSGRSGH